MMNNSNQYTIRKLTDITTGIGFDTEEAAVTRAIETGMSGIGVFLNDKELLYIVDCGQVFGRIQYTPAINPATCDHAWGFVSEKLTYYANGDRFYVQHYRCNLCKEAEKETTSSRSFFDREPEGAA